MVDHLIAAMNSDNYEEDENLGSAASKAPPALPSSSHPESLLFNRLYARYRLDTKKGQAPPSYPEQRRGRRRLSAVVAEHLYG